LLFQHPHLSFKRDQALLQVLHLLLECLDLWRSGWRGRRLLRLQTQGTREQHENESDQSFHTDNPAREALNGPTAPPARASVLSGLEKISL
jgi:hypothetical protein